jgi:Ca-activated chloride channel family protein
MKHGKVMPKDVAFVLDTSGSMAGAKLEQAKKALAFCVENLNDGDRFEILRFATEVEPLFNALTDATREQRARAQNFIKDLRPIGGTAIDDALRKAMALRPDKGDRPFVVIFLTDGRPTVGVTDENAILAGVTRASAGHVRVFCFGIGTDVNTHLLDKITEETRASSQYVLPDEDIEVKVSSFFGRIKEPVLASPRLVFPEGVRVTKLYPAPAPDLFKGEQLVLAGRYAGSADGAIRLEGTVHGEPRTFVFDAKFPPQSADHEFIPRLWATRRVGHLLDEIRLRGENAELKQEVTELARQYGIVTPYTAYLIVEDESRRGLASNVRTFQFHDATQHREAERLLRRSQREKEGDGAVAGARANQALKLADAPGEAIVLGNADAFYAAPALAPRASSAAPAAAGGPALDARARLAGAQQAAAQTRFVGGRSFFQNGNQWVDAGAQRLQNQQARRIQFNSPEYFELWRQEPRAQAWLALGRNVRFVLDGQLYEIFEAVN